MKVFLNDASECDGIHLNFFVVHNLQNLLCKYRNCLFILNDLQMFVYINIFHLCLARHISYIVLGSRKCVATLAVNCNVYYIFKCQIVNTFHFSLD